ncbi:MAG: HAD family hydrolase, partial [Candidatus Aenigmarchaeota archaeon]|nr:HAD family hydrolase [Candidatus Aenigmarchaeota archaeon]MCK5062822.1 HAD family hydrolase [Candidatus Aenigmarchaeota archaeon]MCK5290137.1 HAD family hydrolase [Candidatus Aenigmarchaeota archaeon]MCK5373424.1 HAD family hydrolase [Candidatus Aenigmarchaeota archaeon]MCK5452240.1 HAD family hydrolase [Candidatus Aenigmarchaeota archaeon]
MITHISFDLDGTLVNEKFDKIIWHEEIPKLFAEKNNIDIETATNMVYAEYYRGAFIDKVDRWTDISYWFDRLGLDGWNTLMVNMKKHILVYDDTLKMFEQLSARKYKLIIISNAEEKFLDMKLEAEGLKKHFSSVFSAQSTFGVRKKNKEIFMKVLERLGIKPENMIHVGNDRYLDLEVPSSVGIKSFLLDRTGKTKGDNVIHSLDELVGKV